MEIAQSPPKSGTGVFSSSAYGVRIGFETSLELSPYLPNPLIPGGQIEESGCAPVTFSLRQTRSSAGQPIFTVAANETPLLSYGDVETAARALESQAHQYLAASAQSVVFVHAGVVSWRGKAILIPGPSRSGKSTLVMALVNAGATYYSDEYAVLDLEGRVHPFRRLPRLRPDVQSTQLLDAQWAHDPSLDPLTVGLVLSTRFNPSGITRLKRLTPGQTLLTLVENTVAVRRQAEFTIRALKNAISSALGLQLERDEASGTAQSILQCINESWQARKESYE